MRIQVVVLLPVTKPIEWWCILFIYLLSTHADRHVVDISVIVCLFVCFSVCLSAGILVTDISGMDWRRAMKFCRLVDLGVRQVFSPFGEI